MLYFFAFLDRVNIGFAALTMNEDIGLSAAAFGLGAGIFFIGYVDLRSAEQHDARALRRARLDRPHHDQLGRACRRHGVRVRARRSFYVMRFLLGVAEAGFFPGIIYYLTCWFPIAVSRADPRRCSWWRCRCRA